MVNFKFFEFGKVVSAKFQQELVKERVKDTPKETQNKYQPCDFVLFQRDPAVPRPSKLASPYTGPYEVIQQLKNDVECRHVVMGNIKVLHVTRRKYLSARVRKPTKLRCGTRISSSFARYTIGVVILRSDLGCFSIWNSTTASRFCYRTPRT